MPLRIWLVALLLTAVACGEDGKEDSGEKSSPTGTPTPEIATVTVRLLDQLPLEVLQNAGQGVCTTRNIGDLLDGLETQPVQVTLRDADGTIVGTETLGLAGGRSLPKRQGCEWDVDFEVEASDFFEVSVASREGETTATGQLTSSALTIVVDL